MIASVMRRLELLGGSQEVCQRWRTRHERAPALFTYTAAKTISVICIKAAIASSHPCRQEMLFCFWGVNESFGVSVTSVADRGPVLPVFGTSGQASALRCSYSVPPSPSRSLGCFICAIVGHVLGHQCGHEKSIREHALHYDVRGYHNHNSLGS